MGHSNSILAAMIIFVACTPPQEDPVPENTPASVKKPVSDKEPGDNALQKELDELLQDIDVALEAGDWTRSRQLVNRGISLTSDKRGLELANAQMLLRLGKLEQQTGNETDARRHYTDAMAIFHVHKSDTGRFETFLATGQLETRRGDYVAAARNFEQANSLIPKLKDRSLVGRFQLAIAQLASRQVQHKKAFDAYKEAIDIFAALKDKQAQANTLILLAAEEDALGRLPGSRRSIERAVRLFDEEDNLEGKVRGMHRLATYAERERQYKKAKKLLEDVCELYQQLDMQGAAANVRRHLNALPVQENDKKD